MNNLDYIDDYFNGSITAEQKMLFEQKIITDVAFAEEVAFYVSANSAVKEELAQQKKARFKEIYQQQKVVPAKIIPVRNRWRYLAAASVAAAIIGLTFFFNFNSTSSQQLADKYIQQNFTTMDVNMGDKKDSLQEGLRFLNNGKLTEARKQFELIIKNDSTSAMAKKYAGIVCLRLKDYDKALQYFTSLETDPSLRNNPGKFYKAVTLLERNNNGDKEAAIGLLKEVVAKKLEEKDNAAEWLEKL